MACCFRVALMFLLLVSWGCRPSLKDEELGEVYFAIPRVQGANGPYPLPIEGTPPDQRRMEQPPGGLSPVIPPQADRQPGNERPQPDVEQEP